MVLLDCLRIVRVTRVPVNLRNNPDALMCLYSWFGGVQHVAVASDDSGEAFVVFDSPEGVRRCLARMVEANSITTERDGRLGKLCHDNLAIPDVVLSMVPRSEHTGVRLDDDLPATQREGRLMVGGFDMTVEGVQLRGGAGGVSASSTAATAVAGGAAAAGVVVSGGSQGGTLSAAAAGGAAAAAAVPAAITRTGSTSGSGSSSSGSGTSLPVISVARKRVRSVSPPKSQGAPPPPPPQQQQQSSSVSVAEAAMGSGSVRLTSPVSSVAAAATPPAPAPPAVAPAVAATSTTADVEIPPSIAPVVVIHTVPLDVPHKFAKFKPMNLLMALHLLCSTARPLSILVCTPHMVRSIQRTLLCEFATRDEALFVVDRYHQSIAEFVDPNGAIGFRYGLRASLSANHFHSLKFSMNNDLQALLTDSTLALNGGALPYEWMSLSTCNRLEEQRRVMLANAGLVEAKGSDGADVIVEANAQTMPPSGGGGGGGTNRGTRGGGGSRKNGGGGGGGGGGGRRGGGGGGRRRR